MSAAQSCPRCLGHLRAPTIWSSSWECERHGAVLPYRVVPGPSAASFHAGLALPGAPVWLPDPMPVGWVVTGMAVVGDERSGACATALALSGPNPAGGPGDVVIVAEDPGIGLGARLAGLAGSDPGTLGARRAARVHAARRLTPLWDVVSEPGRDALYGEARGRWLWVVCWPSSTSLLLEEELCLLDARESPGGIDRLAFGAPSRRLASVPEQVPAPAVPVSRGTPPNAV